MEPAKPTEQPTKREDSNGPDEKDQPEKVETTVEQPEQPTKKGDKTVVETVEVPKNKDFENLASPFISQKKVWNDEETPADSIGVPPDLVLNLQEMGFQKPSVIQGVAIPYINKEPYNSIVAQAKTGSGKTGAFAIGTIMRVDRGLEKTQVLVVLHTRELCNQVHAVYESICKGTGISVGNMCNDDKAGQIMVGTHGKIEKVVNGRKAHDLKALRCLVMDECDVFFFDDKNYDSVKAIVNSTSLKDHKGWQWVLFSATFPTQDVGKYEEMQKRISQYVQKAVEIKIKPEKLKLSHIQQFKHRCAQGKKLDFIKEVFATCEATQTFIFVNTKNYAEHVHNCLQKDGHKSYILFGKMEYKERDEIMDRFRNCEINVLVTTNIIARGVDIPEAQLVINYDVPSQKNQKGQFEADYENFLHRIGRTGRFGTSGIALTIYDRDVDKSMIDDIVKYYQMGDSIQELDGPEQLQVILNSLKD